MKQVAVLLTILLAMISSSNNLNAQTAVKWEEIFDSTTPPAEWLVINNDGSPDDEAGPTTWRFIQQLTFPFGGGVVPQAGQSFWESDFEDANSNGLIDEWLISPKVSGIETGDSLVFYAGARGQLDDSLRVLISTTDNQIESFTNQIAYFRVDAGGYTKYQFSLSDFAGSDIFIAVNYLIVDGGPTGANSEFVWVDHFVITGLVTAINDDPLVPNRFELLQNYPNPFNPSTKISFTLPELTEVTLKVYNSLGQEVATIVNELKLQAGQHTYKFSTNKLTSGTYYYRLEAGKNVSSKKMILLK